MRIIGIAVLCVALSACISTDDRGRDASRFYFGADLSYVNEVEECGAVFSVDGVPQDPYELFAQRGANLVRLRLWHSPEWTAYSTLNDVKHSMLRAQAAGMPVLLDFHYSDDWADPGDQIIPSAWSGIEDTSALAAAVEAYTYDTLMTLAGGGLWPLMVQVGNETNTEMLLPAPVPEETPINWERNAVILNAGIAGARRAERDTGRVLLIMLHIAQPEYAAAWFEDAAGHGVTDFDQIGLSYYPKWSTEDFSGLSETIRSLRTAYGADVMVVETAYPWTLDWADEAGNLLGADSLLPDYPATPEGQRDYLLALREAVSAAGGNGVVYWEPAWVSTRCATRWGVGSHWENNTFFDFAGNVHKGMDWMRTED